MQPPSVIAASQDQVTRFCFLPLLHFLVAYQSDTIPCALLLVIRGKTRSKQTLPCPSVTGGVLQSTKVFQIDPLLALLHLWRIHVISPYCFLQRVWQRFATFQLQINPSPSPLAGNLVLVNTRSSTKTLSMGFGWGLESHAAQYGIPLLTNTNMSTAYSVGGDDLR
jgi:hypothetical protein